MALKFINNENFPNYMGVDADISSGCAVGVFTVGHSLYITDTHAWYIATAISGSSTFFETLVLPANQT